MSTSYKIINMQEWKRAMHCQVFRNYVEPMYCISLELDITKFLEEIKKKNYSFTYSMVYAVTKCANEIEEFRYRFLDGEVVLYDKINTSFTYLNKETELFKVVNVEMKDNLAEYVKLADETEKNQTAYFTGPMGVDLYQFSPMPWISYTHISHTISGKKESSTPLFDWGKYFNRDGRVILPFSVQVHHSFVDGIHVGQFTGKLQKYLDEFEA